MRVRRGAHAGGGGPIVRLARLREQRGGSVATFLMVLVPLLGMVSMGVDVGSTMVKRTRMRVAADAAALAGAAWCGKKHGLAETQAKADAIAAANMSGLSRMSFSVDGRCTGSKTGTVYVSYSSPHRRFFAPLVGLPAAAPVRAGARALWGGASSLVRVVPIALSKERLSTCNVPFGVAVGETCAFWWNNSASEHVELSKAEWGLVNLSLWNVPSSAHCSNAGSSTYRDWMLEGYPPPLALNASGPTYLCRDSGYFGNSLDKAIEDLIAANRPVPLPVNDPAGQVDTLGTGCAPGMDCIPDKYAVIGFAWLKLIELHKGNSPAGMAACPLQKSDPNARCLVAQWVGFNASGLSRGPGEGENFGAIAVDLIE